MEAISSGEPTSARPISTGSPWRACCPTLDAPRVAAVTPARPSPPTMPGAVVNGLAAPSTPGKPSMVRRRRASEPNCLASGTTASLNGVAFISSPGMAARAPEGGAPKPAARAMSPMTGIGAPRPSVSGWTVGKYLATAPPNPSLGTLA